MGRKRERIDTSGGGELSVKNPFANLESSGLADAPEHGRTGGTARERPKPKSPGSGRRVELRRLKSGKGGKTVTEVRGLGLRGETLKTFARELKQRCGTGGTVKGENVEIQGDYREPLKELLSDRGYHVVLAGG